MALAHEGNPKEDSITIKAGEVTSTATLSIPLPAGGGISTVPPEPLPDTGDVSTCDTVFTWGPNYLAFTWNGHAYNSVTGDKTRSFDTTSIIQIATTPTCYGITRAAIPSTVTIPDSYSFAISFRGLVSGTPIAGPCFLSAADSIATNATCHAIVVDWSTGFTSFVKFEGASLSSLTNATIIYSAAFLPTDGDYFFLASTQDEFENTVSAKIYAEGDFGGTEKWGLDSTEVVTNICDAGLVAIGGVGSNGTCLFGHSVDDTFHSSVTMFAYSDADTSS